MAQTPPTTSTRKRRARSLASRRAGYAVSIVVNLVVAFIVNNLLAWDLLGFLTDDFEQVLPFINVSIGVSIVSSAVCLWRDPPWVRAAGQVAEGIASVVAIVRTYQVFPFEFSGSFRAWAFAFGRNIRRVPWGCAALFETAATARSRSSSPGRSMP